MKSSHVRVTVLVDRVSESIVAVVAMCSLLLLGLLALFLFKNAFLFFQEVSPLDFLTKIDWNPDSLKRPMWGMLSLLASTLLLSVTSLLIALPLGIAIAIHLSYRMGSRTRQFVKPVIEMIASIPSVTLGLLGILYVAPTVAHLFGLSNGFNGLSASIVVAIATLPTLISISDDALRAVNPTYRHASLALGAQEWETILQVMLPAAKSGVFAAIMLGLGRIIGETMIVLMVSGNSQALPKSLLMPLRPITATIAIEVKEVVTGSTHWSGLFALAVVLFIFTFLLNTLADLIIQKRTVKEL